MLLLVLVLTLKQTKSKLCYYDLCNLAAEIQKTGLYFIYIFFYLKRIAAMIIII